MISEKDVIPHWNNLDVTGTYKPIVFGPFNVCPGVRGQVQTPGSSEETATEVSPGHEGMSQDPKDTEIVKPTPQDKPPSDSSKAG